MRRIGFIVGQVLVVAGFWGITVQAATLTANEVMRRAILAGYYSGKDQVGDVRMTIFDGKEGKTTQTFRIVKFNDEAGGIHKIYISFDPPPSGNGNAVFGFPKSSPGRG